MRSTDGTGPVLVLGGTGEARDLAAALTTHGRSVVTSLAGRIRDPALPVGDVRIGGFSTPVVDGITGLAAYLEAQRCAAVVDATHPFAATISGNAAAATGRTGTPLLRLERPGWQEHPDAGRWTWVDSIDEVLTVGSAARRPLLTTGRQSLHTFLVWADREVTARVVDPPEVALPARWRLIRSRGPYAYVGERALMVEHRTDLLVTKDSGGSHTAAKLDAAGDLGIRVVVIARPPAPADVSHVSTVADALAWLDMWIHR